MPLTLADLNQASEPEFVRLLDGVFEHSPWVARRGAPRRPFSNPDDLERSLCATLQQATSAEQLKLIRAHPDLAGRAARSGDLTEASTQEQMEAGLDTLSEAEYQRFTQLNSAYQAKFDFPFILAVKGHDKHSILASFETRLENTLAAERQTALAEICKIAGFRLKALLSSA